MPADADPRSRAAPDTTFKRVMQAFGTLAGSITPWLLDLGSWLFGALIALNLLILAALLTVGPVDPAVLVSTAALAAALPPDAGGFFLLRLVRDMDQIGLEEVAVRSFQGVGFSVEGAFPSSDDMQSRRRRRAGRALRYAYLMLFLSLLATLTGLTATLWHMAWWIAVVFMGAVAVILAVLAAALNTPPPRVAYPKDERAGGSKST